jgi:vacuolar protein sorting-associated protein 29
LCTNVCVLAMQLDVDVLVTGHTHQNGVLEYEGKFFVNPGSITGAYSPLKTWVPAPAPVVSTILS